MILNLFKKKKKEKKQKQEVKAVKPDKKPVEKSLAKKQELETEVRHFKKSKNAYLILKSPHIAEKASQLYEMNQYTFKVYPEANKTEIKKAIEGVYKVNVLKVRTSKVPRRKRRLGKTIGWRKGYKKAVVTIKKGQEIEILPR